MDKDFSYYIEKLKGLDCPNKYLVSINCIKICFTNSIKAAQKVILYASGVENAINNNSIKNKVRKALKR